MLDKIGKTDLPDNIISKLPKEINPKEINPKEINPKEINPKEIKPKTWKELFIIIVEKYFYLYKRLEEWMNAQFNDMFKKAYYTFNIISYLEKQGYSIVDMPTFKHVSTFDRGDLFKIVFNDNIRRT